jgi:peptidoglycan/xylan/chitin deacetylase (PgdA/CDA1 family)
MKVNISIDDVSPHPLSSHRVLDRCYELIDDFPEIKFTLFVPTAYWRTVREGIRTPRPLPLYEHLEFCKLIKSLSPKNFEIGYHGLYHGIPGVSDNDEFQSLDYETAMKKFQDIKDVVNEADMGHVFKPIFRPPAWRMSPDAIRAAKDAGIRTLALSSKPYAKQTYCGVDEDFENVVYYDSNPPFDPLVVKASNEIVYHACEWDKNYLSKELSTELKQWLQQKSVQFCFIEELLSR